LPRTTFCWFATAQRSADRAQTAAGPPRRTRPASSSVIRRSPPCPSLAHPAVPEHRVEIDDDRLSRMGRSRKSPSCRRSSVTNATPARCTRGRAASQPPPADLDVPDVAGQAEERTGDLGAARAHQAGQAEDLALGDVERDRTHARTVTEVAHRQRHGLERRRGGRVPASELPPHHSDSSVPRSSSPVGRSATTRPSRMTTTRWLSRVTSSRVVRDVEDSDALGPQLFHDPQ